MRSLEPWIGVGVGTTREATVSASVRMTVPTRRHREGEPKQREGECTHGALRLAVLSYSSRQSGNNMHRCTAFDPLWLLNRIQTGADLWTLPPFDSYPTHWLGLTKEIPPYPLLSRSSWPNARTLTAEGRPKVRACVMHKLAMTTRESSHGMPLSRRPLATCSNLTLLFQGQRGPWCSFTRLGVKGLRGSTPD